MGRADADWVVDGITEVNGLAGAGDVTLGGAGSLSW